VLHFSTRFKRTMPHCKLHLQQPRSPHKRRRGRAIITDMSIIRSKPIPIPPREADPDSNNAMMTTREAAEIYDAATWRMFELITSARLRAATSSNSYYYCRGSEPTSQHRHVVLTQDDHPATAAITSSQQQRRDATHRDREYSPIPEPTSVPQAPSSMIDGVFTMDL